MHGVKIHAVCVMSNHIHIVLTDMRGELPLFAARFLREAAECIRAHHGVSGVVWEPGRKYSAVELVTERAVQDEITYTLGNPVAAGLVARAKDWPGLISTPSALCGTSLEGERPDWFRNRQAATERLEFCMPPCFAGRAKSEIVHAIEANLDSREHSAAATLRGAGQRVMGAERVSATDPFDAPAAEGSDGDLNPTFATGEREAHRRAIVAAREWRIAYRSALDAWRNGNKNVEFPAGTWWMARFARARVAPGGPPSLAAAPASAVRIAAAADSAR